MTRGRANWTRAALIAVGLVTAACGGDAVPQPAVTGPVKGAPMVQIPVETTPDAVETAPTASGPEAADPAATEPEAATPSVPDPEPAGTKPDGAGQATADATDAADAPPPAAGDASSGTTADGPAAATDADTDTTDATDAPEAAAGTGTIGDVDEPHVPETAGSKEDAVATSGDGTAAAAPEKTEPAKPEAAKTDEKPWPETKKGEALLVTFDDLASFVWIDPGAPAEPAGGSDLGPPDPSADASAAKPDTTAPAPGPDHVGPSGVRTSEIPKKIKQLAGRTVSVEGYMIPLEFDEDGAVRKFLLSRYMQGCCFGMLPQANELILVEMTNPEGTAYEPYLTVLATGKFSVHDKGAALGALKTLYEIQATTCKFVIDR